METVLTPVIVNTALDPCSRFNLSLIGEGTEHRTMGIVTLEKRSDGKLYANGREVVRYYSPNQLGTKTIRGHKLREELKHKQVLNACILDALLANPYLIPEDWKVGFTYFWSTVFSSARGRLVVLCLHWQNDQWHVIADWLHNDWRRQRLAAMLTN